MLLYEMPKTPNSFNTFHVRTIFATLYLRLFIFWASRSSLSTTVKCIKSSVSTDTATIREGNFTRIVNRIIKHPHPNRCSIIPNKTVIITTITGPAFDMVMLQRELFPMANDMFCFERIMLIVCLDSLCMRQCKTHNIKGCVRHPGLSPLQYPVDQNSTLAFNSANWRLATYLKYEVFYSAFVLGLSSVLMIDGDVILIRNPFVQIMDYYWKYDVLHQAELGNGCDAPINSGVLLIRNTKKGRRVVESMIQEKHTILEMPNSLEQTILGEIIEGVDASRCALPNNMFAGHCPHAHNDSMLMGDLIAYHFHCIRSYHEKIARLYHFVKVAHIAGTLGQAELS